MKRLFLWAAIAVAVAIAGIAPGLLLALPTWLFFSFVHWDPSPEQWNGFTRFLAVLIWFFWSVLFGTFAVQNAFDQITKRLKRKDDDS